MRQILTTVCMYCLLVTWFFLAETGDPGSISMFHTQRSVWVLDRNNQILPAPHHLTHGCINSDTLKHDVITETNGDLWNKRSNTVLLPHGLWGL